MATWSEIRDGWSTSWRSTYDDAVRRYQDAVARDPERFRSAVTATMNELAQAKRYLDELDRLVASGSTAITAVDRRDLALAHARYNDLAAGVLAGARRADTGEAIGVAPLVAGGLIVLGLAITAAAVCWAVVAYEYCVNLREQTQLKRDDLDARVDASKGGRTLQPSTVDVPTKDDVPSASTLLWGVAALAAVATAIAVARS